MKQKLLQIGFGNVVATDRVVSIIAANSSPAKRLKDEAKKDARLIDATQGRKTRSILILDSKHIVLSSVQVETMSSRYEQKALHN